MRQTNDHLDHDKSEHNDHHHHHHQHSHDHDHDHDHDDQYYDHDSNGGDRASQTRTIRRLYIATTLCSVFLLIEAIGGYIAGSLAIMSDAAHLFADLASFAVALIAAHLAALPSSASHTYGLQRTESLAALFSMASLAVVSIGLFAEACQRLYLVFTGGSLHVDGKLMTLIAAIGVFINIVLAIVLGEDHAHMPGSGHDHSREHREHEHLDHNNNDEEQQQQQHDNYGRIDPLSHEYSPAQGVATVQDGYGSTNDASGTSESTSLISHHNNELVPQPLSKQRIVNVNLQAAYLHVLGDLAQSGAVLLAGLIVWFRPQWQIVDPIATIGFCVLVFCSTIPILRSSVAVILEQVPPAVSWQRIFDQIHHVSGVSAVHDLHIWSISQGRPALSVHCSARDVAQAMQDISAISRQNGIQHATIQVQPDVFPTCLSCTSANLRCQT